jgi:G3E family GTPase
MTKSGRIPVVVLSGFLGSGKTTLLNALLRQPGMSGTAVIVNELGDIAIDQLLVAGSTESLVVLESGCLCCAMLSSLRETLLDLQARRATGQIRPYVRVIVETTGLADPAPIMLTLLRDVVVNRDFRLGGLITTIDVVHSLASLPAYREASAQLALADRVVVTKTDLRGDVVPAALWAALRNINAAAPILRSSEALADIEQLLHMDLAPTLATRALPSAITTPVLHSAVRADSFVVEGPIGWAGIAAWSGALQEYFGSRLLRCKGLLGVSELRRPVLIQAVQGMFAAPEALPCWPDADQRSRLVCISRGIEECELQACLPLLQLEAGTFRPATLMELMA